jgi:hypothetical protein
MAHDDSVKLREVDAPRAAEQSLDERVGIVEVGAQWQRLSPAAGRAWNRFASGRRLANDLGA